MAIVRVTAEWTGFQGAPGYSNFFFEAGGQGVPDSDRTIQVAEFFDTLASRLPQQVTVAVDQEVAIIDEATGQLISYESNPEPIEDIEGTATAVNGYSSATGGVITWLTDTVVGGGRVQGRTFIVPLSSISYQTDGTLTSGTLDVLRNAAALLAGEAAGFRVWSRPRNGGSGVAAPVTGYRVPDMTAVLRSRRD